MPVSKRIFLITLLAMLSILVFLSNLPQVTGELEHFLFLSETVSLNKTWVLITCCFYVVWNKQLFTIQLTNDKQCFEKIADQVLLMSALRYRTIHGITWQLVVYTGAEWNVANVGDQGWFFNKWGNDRNPYCNDAPSDCLYPTGFFGTGSVDCACNLPRGQSCTFLIPQSMYGLLCLMTSTLWISTE